MKITTRGRVVAYIALLLIAFAVGALTANIAWDGDAYTVIERHGGSSTNIDYIEEDDPRWDCATMGNQVCGSISG